MFQVVKVLVSTRRPLVCSKVLSRDQLHTLAVNVGGGSRVPVVPDGVSTDQQVLNVCAVQ